VSAGVFERVTLSSSRIGENELVVFVNQSRNDDFSVRQATSRKPLT